MPPLRTCSFILALLTVVTGCPDAGAKRSGPAKPCTKAYVQCALAEGLLGVCDPVECKDGQGTGCFICRPQH